MFSHSQWKLQVSTKTKHSRALYTMALCLGVALTSASAWAGVASALFEGRVGRFLFAETAEGERIAHHLLGRLPGNSRELRQILDLGTHEVPGLEAQLEELERRFLAHSPGANPERLSAAQKALLKREARRLLKTGNSVDADGEARLVLESVETGETYADLQNKFAGPGRKAKSSFISSNFPPKLWQGSLGQRVEKLVSKWPKNVQVVHDLKFDYTGPRHGPAPQRDVVMISSDGLDEIEFQALVQDYVHAFGRGTVSFPLSEGAGHLYTRFGSGVVDFIHELGHRGYQAERGTARLEAVIVLSAQEELKLARYVDNATANPGDVLGRFGYNGVADGATRKKLTDNRAIRADDGVGHNCTSWLATAPVGEKGAPLLSLVGAKIKDEVHTNPGWWSSYLMGAAPTERVPFGIFWIGETPIAAKIAELRAARGKVTWEFDPH